MTLTWEVPVIASDDAILIKKNPTSVGHFEFTVHVQFQCDIYGKCLEIRNYSNKQTGKFDHNHTHFMNS